MTIPEAIAEFREAAQAKGDFGADSAEDHALHQRMAVAFRFLSEQGAEGRSAFAALLHDDSAHVRSWVSAQLLSEGDAQAIPIAEQLALAPGVVGFDSRITLKEFRAGRLRSPFATRVT